MTDSNTVNEDVSTSVSVNENETEEDNGGIWSGRLQGAKGN